MMIIMIFIYYGGQKSKIKMINHCVNVVLFFFITFMQKNQGASSEKKRGSREIPVGSGVFKL